MITNVLTYLERATEKESEKLALVSEIETYSYLQLSKIAKAIGSFVSEFGHRNLPIFIFMQKSARTIAAFMGVLYSGNFYVPIDVSQPVERIGILLESAEPALIITDENNIDKISQIPGAYEKTVLFEEIRNTTVNNIKLENIRNQVIDIDPIYMMFTSGSTGVPKGVVISHHSVIDYVEWVENTFQIASQDILGNQAPFYFDNSILDIYTTLKVGATLHIVPQTCFSFPDPLFSYLNRNRITLIFCVPSVLCNIARLWGQETINLPFLKKILFCGEVMPTKYLNEWRRKVPNALYANLYGPTECTDVCSAYIVDREFEDDAILPIGKACRNTELLLLTENGNVAKTGEMGEICVRGRSLALGYYSDAEKTDAAFVQNPLNSKYRDLIYKTGDIARINEYGEILYLGRKDAQIKYMGYRIELGEIEASAGRILGVDLSVCVYDQNTQKIWLFYSGTLEEKLVRGALMEKLPRYMVPREFRQVNEFPYNANGKIDRKKLLNQYINE